MKTRYLGVEMSDNTALQPEARSSKSPVLIMAAVIGGLQVLLGGAALADFVDVEVIGLANLVLAAVTTGFGIFTKGQVTPWVDVVAKATSGGLVVAGPAAREVTGREVVVVSAGDGGVVAPPAANNNPEV
jgi:hypothetical protein